ncbi:MAG: biotin/lipoyl-containing protein [Oscillochloridaceae bacterium]|nr:acetyl-CoA carboxylase biotin carboxyl carrier protein subunit [Chloroflexaceae bacterium]MDW8390903.1 biotin/lipoyl-containing protein [Oscillochloridaceae bacterium]
MRRYRLTVGGRQFEIAVETLGPDRYQVELEGKQYEVTLESLAAGALDGAALPLPRAEEVAPTVSPAPAASEGALLTAPMPGTVLRIEVSVGQTVRRGDPVLVLEAMKMQNLIRAPGDGAVSEVLVTPGQTVGHGEPLVRFVAEGR